MVRSARTRFHLSSSVCSARTLDKIAGGDVQENAAIIRAILDGERSCRRDVVLLNAAAALVAAGHADQIGDAVPLAAYAIDSGHARQRLQLLIEFTNRG